MKEQNIAKVYAQSFLELSQKYDVDIVKELTTVTETINVSNELENLLY